jgi:hypothetical protein
MTTFMVKARGAVYYTEFYRVEAETADEAQEIVSDGEYDAAAYQGFDTGDNVSMIDTDYTVVPFNESAGPDYVHPVADSIRVTVTVRDSEDAVYCIGYLWAPAGRTEAQVQETMASARVQWCEANPTPESDSDFCDYLVAHYGFQHDRTPSTDFRL